VCTEEQAVVTDDILVIVFYNLFYDIHSDGYRGCLNGYKKVELCLI
jgi:hypothetical protein